MVMGYLPIEERHYPALLSLVASAQPTVRLLDPFAGEGTFLEAVAQAWSVTPYANELDGERAAACITRFGATQAVRCDVERLVASNNAFGAAWLNPPYVKLIEEQGAWKTSGFQALLDVPPPPAEIEPVVAPRPGHLTLVLATSVADGAVIETDEYGRVGAARQDTARRADRSC